MAFANIIKKLRHERDMTQDELAEALGITPQAVSRWETGMTSPDTAIIAKLAYLFDVTADYLLEIDTVKIDSKIKEICDRAYQNPGDEASEELRRALEQYPQNLKLTEALMLMPFYYHPDAKTDAEKRERRRRVDEAIRCGEYILAHATDPEMLGGARYILMHYYRETGDRAKAETLIESVGNLSEKLDMRITLAEGTPEWVSLMQEKVYEHLNALNWNIYILSIANAYVPGTYTSEQSAAMLEKLQKANEILIDADAPYFYSCNPLHLPWQLAKRYCEIGQYDKAIEQLEIMKESALEPNKFEGKKKFPLRSLIFDRFECEKHSHMWDAAWMLDILGDSYYDSIRSDPRFAKIESELKAAIKDR